MKETVDQINQAIRDNPLAAGLIGVGLFMTFFGNAGLPKLAAKIPEAAKGAARAATDGISAGARSIADAAGAAGGRIGETAANMAEQAPSLVPGADVDTGKLSERAGEMAAGVKESLVSGAGQVRERVTSAAQSGWDASAALRGQLGESLERQPLLLGAIGLAIGAGLASVLPATETERELMGEKASALREEVTNRAGRVVEDVRQEATAQGFTQAAAKDALQDVARRARNVASSARDSVTNQAT
jgi:hypothetical protein